MLSRSKAFPFIEVAPLPLPAGATSPRESFGFQRGAAADPLRVGGGAYGEGGAAKP